MPSMPPAAPAAIAPTWRAAATRPALGGNGFMSSASAAAPPRTCTSSSPPPCRRARPAAWARSIHQRHRLSAVRQRRQARAQRRSARTPTSKFPPSPTGKVPGRSHRRRPALGKMAAAEARAARRSAAAAAWPDRQGHGEELCRRHRRHADASGGRRMADVPAQLSGLELQPAQADHARQCEDPDPEMGLEHERGRRQPGDADRPCRHDVPVQHLQHGAGAGCAHRRADLGEPPRAGVARSPMAAPAASPSITTRSLSRPPTPCPCAGRAHRQAWCGNRRWAPPTTPTPAA